MRTPDSDRSLHKHQLFRRLCPLLVLASLLAVIPAAATAPASPAPDTPTAPGVPPLAEFLNPDGSLALPAGQAISLDPRGYELVSGPGEAPRFVPAQPDANPGDENWASGLFPLRGMNDEVWALAVDAAGNLYAGGYFTVVGGVSASRIAKWDGNAWSALGSGVGGVEYPYVYALAVDATGNLYASGRFTTAGGVPASGIAKWDGTAWSALGSGMGGTSDPYVFALALDAAGSLYAGGYFFSAGGASANHIAKWDGNAWSALGSGMDGYEPYVTALALDAAGNLYAGGGFTTAGGVNANHIAKWDGNTWSALGGGMNSDVQALALDASGNLYAGGEFTTAGGVSANYVAKWDGTVWSALGSSVNDYIRALAVDAAGNLYAGGLFVIAGGVGANKIAKWDGTAWSALGSGMDGTNYPYVNVLALDAAGNLYAGGWFTTAGGVGARNIAQWDGTAWSALGSGMNDYVRALALDAAGNLYAGGYFTTAGGVSANKIAQWDGNAWSALGSGMNGGVYALAVDAAGNIYAGGEFTTAGGVNANRIAKWDGTAWSALGSGVSGPVHALVFDAAGNLYAGGDFETAGGVPASAIAKWDGTAWSALGSGMGGTFYPHVYALAVDAAGNLYAGGDFGTAGGVNANGIAQWDGTAWSALGSGMNSQVFVLALDAAGNLYAGGDFTTAGGVSANGIAQWDGAVWSALGSGVSYYLRALAVDATGNLYAGGEFTTAGGVNANSVAQWDGTAWSALGSGVGGNDPVVFALALDAAGNLYAGGGFTTAGDHVSAYVARWTAADGVRGVTIGNYTFYANNLPVTIHVVTLGTLDRLTLQRFNRSHPQASPDLETGYYWEIVGADASGNPASGYVVDLTLPTTFTTGADDRVCRYTGSTWDCAASAFTANSITRTGITQLSDWAVQDNVACADFDGDGTIDIDDLIAIATRWGQTSGTPGWDGRFDLRPDGRIDIVDIQLTAAQWGQGCAL